ncbi:cyclin-dependent kinase 3-like isoform X2 [Contarinia nasturtii]|nr:cyclin-dependent kinase 3-like isoform X2 [Contarinia nasturtii]
MKKINLDLLDNGLPTNYIREMSVLKSLRHENVVTCFGIIWDDDNQIYLIFEYMQIDLHAYIDQYVPAGLKLREVRNYLYQISKGLEFCHKRAVIHRDLKPENILINEYGVVKIADFGLSRQISVPIRIYSTYVVTLWYRAPELLLGNKRYGYQYGYGIDMWSIGCIFAEMFTGSGLFQGDSEVDQIRKIFSILGAPNEDQWPGVTDLPNYPASFKEPITEKGLEKKVLLRGAGLQLLEMLLIYDPNKRISAKQMLTHQYFSGMDPKKLYPPHLQGNYTD